MNKMDEKANKPSIRFAGFTDVWERHKLGDIVDVCSGKDYKHLEDGDIPVYGTGGYMLSVNEALSYDEDAIGIGRKGTIDNPYLLKAPFWTVDTLFYAVPKRDYSLNFAFDVFQTIDWKRKDESTGVPSLSKTAINNVDVICPKYGEQQLIGGFFSSIDDLIILHQRKYDKLLNIKKSMLEKMFPQAGVDVPEVRFPGFTGAWERRKIGDIVTEVERPITMKDEVVYQLVTVKRRNEGVVSRGFLKGTDILVKNYFMIHEGDYLISKRQVIHGANGYVPKELNYAVVSNEYMVAISNEFVSSKFWVLMSKRREMYRMFLLSSYGVDIEKMVFNVNDWKKRFVMIPSMSEQNRIISVFEHLDTLITLHQRKLTKLQNIKKSCLEKMIV